MLYAYSLVSSRQIKSKLGELPRTVNCHVTGCVDAQNEYEANGKALEIGTISFPSTSGWRDLSVAVKPTSRVSTPENTREVNFPL